MKKTILTYGGIAGTILAVLMFIQIPLWENGTLTFDNGELVGYAGMVVALSLIFFGVKSYRDYHRQGAISFGQGFKVGILITLIAALFYCAAWEITYNFTGQEFMQKMLAHQQQEMKLQGASDETLQQAQQEFEAFSAMYQNPVIRIAMTFLEVFPVGLFIALVSAALLRRPGFLALRPAT